MRSLQERYNDDPIFRSMVDSLVHSMEAGIIAPTEAREAAMFAQIMYENKNPRPRLLHERTIFTYDHIDE